MKVQVIIHYELPFELHKSDIIFLTPFYDGDDYRGAEQFHTCNVSLFKLDSWS